MVYKKKILIFGGTGMLGSKLVETFVTSKKYELSATFRQATRIDKICKTTDSIKWIPFEIVGITNTELKNLIINFDYIFNAIGAIPQKYDSKNIKDVCVLLAKIYMDIYKYAKYEIYMTKSFELNLANLSIKK